MSSSNSILSVRVSAAERGLLETAAENARTTLSDFVRRRALEAAEADLLDRRVISIPAQDWERFEAWVNEPPKLVPALRELAASSPVWES